MPNETFPAIWYLQFAPLIWKLMREPSGKGPITSGRSFSVYEQTYSML
jgi:hypothetical protein